MAKVKAFIAKVLSRATEEVKETLEDKRGESSVGFLGSIIIAVIIIGLLAIAVNAAFPPLFANILGGVQAKLTANW